LPSIAPRIRAFLSALAYRQASEEQVADSSFGSFAPDPASGVKAGDHATRVQLRLVQSLRDVGHQIGRVLDAATEEFFLSAPTG
jgi:hypothetical protein